MRLTERLNVEHGLFLRQIDELEALVRQEAPAPALAAVTRMIASNLEPHRQIEERLLYPSFEDTIGLRLPDLLAEHQEIERLAQAVASGHCEQQFVEAFIAALRTHIAKEVHVIFPMVEEWVPCDRLSAMSNWHLEHLQERATRIPTRWPEKHLG